MPLPDTHTGAVVGGTAVAQPGGMPAPTWIASAPVTVRVEEALRRAAATDVRVALYGEPGVGKAHAANYLHLHSRRREAPVRTLSVRDQGVATRLSDRAFLSSLVGGTLVLSGVDEAPPEVQTLLVGVIEEWCGPDERAEAPLRVISTGVKALLGQVERGRIRPDLHYLLDVFPLVIPPLRERTEEVPLFLEYFFRRHLPGGEPPPAPRPFLHLAGAHAWPGNLRELENLVLSSLPAKGRRKWRFPRTLPSRAGEPELLTFSQAKREFEQAYVRRLLTVTGGNVSRAAGLAGKARKDFYALMARNRIDPVRFRVASRK